MYEFRDTISASRTALLPSEALKINGEYIEDQVSGYRTLYVKGRELLAPQIESYETGIRDGAVFCSKRYPARTLVVGYQLIAPSNAAFRAAYHALNAVLNVEEAEFIFADEPDKFLIGTPSAASEVAPGTNAVTGEFEILCSNPFKYSVVEHTADGSAANGVATIDIDYGGTYRAYPVLEADFANETEDADGHLTGKGDCGYVVFWNDQGKIIQLGDPDEPDTEDYPKSQTLVNQKFTTYGVEDAAKWPVNTGRTSSDNVVQTGMVAVASDGTGAKTKMLYASNYGSGSTYHGPSVTRTIPADQSGHVGAKNFRLTYQQRLCIGTGKNDSKQRGVFQALCVNRTGDTRKIVAGVSVYKNSTGAKGFIRYYVNGRTKKDVTIDLTQNNPYFGYGKSSVLTSVIQKEGEKITFHIGGKKQTYQDSTLADTEIHEITFVFGKYASYTALSTNGLYWAKLVSDACETFRDIPNKFSADDVVMADCKTGEIYLNGSRAPELGALGNDWEEFYLVPGANQLKIAWSDWVPAESAPSVSVRYREVFL